MQAKCLSLHKPLTSGVQLKGHVDIMQLSICFIELSMLTLKQRVYSILD